MEVLALVVWVAAVAGGLYLLAEWIANDGIRQQGTGETRFPLALAFGHPLLAVLALGVWVLFLTSARRIYAWSAFAVLLVAAALGFTMLVLWLTGHRQPRNPARARAAERAFPLPAVIAHGAAGVLTLLLVFLSLLVT